MTSPSLLLLSSTHLQSQPSWMLRSLCLLFCIAWRFITFQIKLRLKKPVALGPWAGAISLKTCSGTGQPAGLLRMVALCQRQGLVVLQQVSAPLLGLLAACGGAGALPSPQETITQHGQCNEMGQQPDDCESTQGTSRGTWGWQPSDRGCISKRSFNCAHSEFFPPLLSSSCPSSWFLLLSMP